jgi:predicted anti-sigma-YlaC factor YlaD
MKCKNIQRNLIFYLEGDLTRERREEIKDHLGECGICRNLADNLASNLKIIENEKTLQPNSFLYTRINEKINNYHYKQNAFITYTVKILRPAIISFFIAFGIFAGIKLGAYFKSKYINNTSELQIETYYLNDMEHESVETALLSDAFETENIN